MTDARHVPRIEEYIACSQAIPGWTRDEEAAMLARVCLELPPKAVVVEIGSFLGSSAVLLAGARKLCGSGKVHCVDPFDASGDAYSIPFYRAVACAQKESLRQRFDQYLDRAGLTNWVHVHHGTAEAIATRWRAPIDMLFLDGDQSPEGARVAYDRWATWLKKRGVIALHNSSERVYGAGHDGHRRLVLESVRPPRYTDIFCVGTTTFARRS